MTIRRSRPPVDQPASAPALSAPAADAGDVAQRPRLTTRLRLVPFVVLLVCALAAGVLGTVDDTPLVDPAVAVAAAQTKADKASKRAAKKCTPTYNPGRAKTDPWGPGRAKASERAFKKRIKKEEPAYVQGRRGFKFFTDYQVDDFSQSLGRVRHNAKQEKRWASFFTRTAAAVEAAGSDFRVVIAPSKNTIYRQNLPAWAHRLRGETSLEQLLADHPEVPWIDTRAALRKAAGKNATYEALNNHWTPYGGYVAWRAMTACLGLTAGFEALGVPPLAGVQRVPSSNDFAPQGVPALNDRTVPVLATAHPPTTLTQSETGAPIAPAPDDSVDLTVLPATTTTTGAQSPATLLALRDSTGSQLSALWSTSFARTVQYGHGLDRAPLTTKQIVGLVRRESPALTLYVMTERYLDYRAPR